jgi:N-acyl-D-amino-acid deacylase
MRLNVAAMIGHTALRIYALGAEATERVATVEEIEQMRSIVGEAIDAGAIGFATSKSPTHSGDAGKPVPSRFAEIDEITRIASVMGEKGHGTFQATIGPGFYVKEIAALSEEIGRPATWTALLTLSEAPGRAMETLNKQAALGGEVWPQIACRPLVFQITLEDPFPFAMAAGFDEILAAPRAARADIYADPEWRDRVRPELDRVWGHTWGKDWIDETEKHVDLRQGPSIAEIAASRGQHPMDAMIDLALEEDLKTRFAIVLANDGKEEIAELLADNRAVIGLSDAGAHASQICDACFSTHLLGHWVRELGAISLEQGVHRLTAHAANVFRIADRGVLRPGAFADLCAFDADTVGVGSVDRVFDLPAGADRLLARSTGIEHVWVNGRAIRLDGKDIDGARPGRLIRGGTA